ncbi:MAG TPA: HlyD family efflux transporter periplasmic adaptor subunit [Candidatus Hydrogenedentes bacterium]|nr:HlyD family efflux transporter periplasmic adaptor subunit [Candidatus Hydrogenedentota bacterium]
MNKKKRLILLLPVVVIATILTIQYLRDGSNRDPNVLRVSGNVEVTDADVGFKINGRVVRRLVDEGQTIQAGQTVAILDTADLEQEVALRQAEWRAAHAVLAELEAGSRPEEIAQNEAAVDRAKARLAELEAGSRSQEIAAAQATVNSAKAELERTRADFERQRQLLAQDVISEREFETSEAAFQVATARYKESLERSGLVREGPRTEEIEQARKALREAEERLAVVRKGPRAETIAQARARLDQAAAAVELAKVRLGYASVSSPLTGIVLSENVEPGEYVSPGTPVITVGDLVNVWLRAYIDETDLGRVRVGQLVEVTTDTYPGKVYEGRIAFISSQAEFTPKTVQTEKERVKLVYRVKIDIANPAMELKPGMPADGRIRLAAGGM